MKSVLNFISKYSEYYIIMLILLCGYSPYRISPMALVLAGLLILQIIFKNKITGILISSVLACINLYMVLAVISEFSGFPSGNNQSYILLSVGFGIIAANLLVCYLMFTKYSEKQEKLIVA